MPFVPCTEIAPTTSSSFAFRSMNSHERHTRMPATRPMMTDGIGLTKPLGAVIATRPARTGEVAVAVAEAVARTERRKPSAAPRPVAVDRIRERAHEERRDDERGVSPPLRCGSGDDGERRIHEHHLEEEHHHDADVIGGAPEHHPLRAEQPPVLAEQTDGDL